MITYLAWYLGVGAVVVSLLLIANKMKSQVEPELSSFFKDELHESLWSKMLVPVIAMAIVTLIWPALVVMKARELMTPDDAVQGTERKKFSVSRGDLRQQMTLDEIERRERIHDPLKAVADLPFGHLNPAWMKYRERITEEDQVWSFTANYSDEWSTNQYLEGYVYVRDGVNRPGFVGGFIS